MTNSRVPWLETLAADDMTLAKESLFFNDSPWWALWCRREERSRCESRMDSTHVRNRTWPVCPCDKPMKISIHINCRANVTSKMWCNAPHFVSLFFLLFVFCFLCLPVTKGGEDSRDDVGVRWGVGMVKITPALVPTHKRSRNSIIDVTRKQAALCWRIMSSQPEINDNTKRYIIITQHSTPQAGSTDYCWWMCSIILPTMMTQCLTEGKTTRYLKASCWRREPNWRQKCIRGWARGKVERPPTLASPPTRLIRCMPNWVHFSENQSSQRNRPVSKPNI